MKALDREILRLAIPSILANITVPFVGMVDIAVAGHLHSAANSGAAAFIGGISVGALLLNVIYWNFFFLRAGTGGLTAQAFGRRKAAATTRGRSQNSAAGALHHGTASGSSAAPAPPQRMLGECGSLLVHGVALALGFAVLLLLFQWPLSRLAMLFADRTPGVAELAVRYFFVRVWAAPATLSLMAIKGWFIGMQDTVSSMFTDLVVNLVNIAGSIVLTLGLGGWQGIGFDGIALGTVIAQYSGLAFALAVLAIKYRAEFTPVATGHEGKLLTAAGFRPFLNLNTDLFIRSLCFTGIYMGFTVIAARYGEVLLACSNIMMTLLMLFSYFTDGFAYAGEALVGRFIGERDSLMVRKSVAGTFKWSFAVAGVWMLIYWLARQPLLRIMTDDPAVLDACTQFLPWLVAMPLLGCAAFAWDGIYVGATASRPIRDAMLLALISFLGVWFLGQPLLSAAGIVPVQAAAEGTRLAAALAPAIHLLLAAYFAHLAARTAYLTVVYYRRLR